MCISIGRGSNINHYAYTAEILSKNREVITAYEASVL